MFLTRFWMRSADLMSGRCFYVPSSSCSQARIHDKNKMSFPFNLDLLTILCEVSISVSTPKFGLFLKVLKSLISRMLIFPIHFLKSSKICGLWIDKY